MNEANTETTMNEANTGGAVIGLSPQVPQRKNFTVQEVENGYVVYINTSYPNKHYIASTKEQAIKIINDNL